jgi:endonuclease YncB( thermonuclease family)
MRFTRYKQMAAKTQGMRALLRAVLLLGACITTLAHAWPGIVTHVSDGDTVWVQPLQRGEAQKVRLLGIDAPEICQPWGPQSRAALHAALQGQVVEVRARTRDSYGRLLAQLTRQGNDVGAWMVGQGYAWSYSYKNNAGPYEALQLQAQMQHLGLFSDGRALQPRWFRKRFGSCHLPTPDAPH